MARIAPEASINKLVGVGRVLLEAVLLQISRDLETQTQGHHGGAKHIANVGCAQRLAMLGAVDNQQRQTSDKGPHGLFWGK